MAARSEVNLTGPLWRQESQRGHRIYQNAGCEKTCQIEKMDKNKGKSRTMSSGGRLDHFHCAGWIFPTPICHKLPVMNLVCALIPPPEFQTLMLSLLKKRMVSE